MSYRVTHIDHAGRRRQMVLACEGRTAAEALATAMYGEAHYLAVVRIGGR